MAAFDKTETQILLKSEFETGRTGTDFGTQFRSPQQSLTTLQQYSDNNQQYNQYGTNTQQTNFGGQDQAGGLLDSYEGYSGELGEVSDYISRENRIARK